MLLDNSSNKPQKKTSFLKYFCVALPVIILGGGFYLLNGNFHSGTISPDRFMDVVEAGDLHDSGFRRAHAKGVCVSGSWQGSAEMSPYAKVKIFEVKAPVSGRFSLGPGNPFVPDTQTLTRSMALKINTPEGVWETAMNNTPVIPMSNAQDAYDLFKTDRIDPKTGKPDPQAFVNFAKTHPWLSKALKILSKTKPSSGMADTVYYGVSSFLLTDKSGKKHAVRWKMVPNQQVEAAEGKENDPDYLFKGLMKEGQDGISSQKKLSWTMVMMIADSAPEILNGTAPKDAVADPSKIWNDHDLQIKAGTVTFDKFFSENESGSCKSMSFDPTILPKGFELSKDPIPALRSQLYMKSFQRRAGEAQKPSEITDNMIKQGENS